MDFVGNERLTTRCFRDAAIGAAAAKAHSVPPETKAARGASQAMSLSSLISREPRLRGEAVSLDQFDVR